MISVTEKEEKTVVTLEEKTINGWARLTLDVKSLGVMEMEVRLKEPPWILNNGQLNIFVVVEVEVEEVEEVEIWKVSFKKRTEGVVPVMTKHPELASVSSIYSIFLVTASDPTGLKDISWSEMIMGFFSATCVPSLSRVMEVRVSWWRYAK